MSFTYIPAGKVECSECPLRRLHAFRPFTSEELRFMMSFKTGELLINRGTTLLVEGSHSAHLYTLLSGFAFRYKLLEDGRRQILNYAMPGDLIGLQGTLMGEMQHSVESLTAVRLCVFERGRIEELYARHPGLAYDMTWIAAREERILDEHLLSIGRRTAIERAAYLLAFLTVKSAQTGYAQEEPAVLPLTQQHVADTLGLSIVHTNKTLRKLAAMGYIRWFERGCEVRAVEPLRQLSGWREEAEPQRPFL
jgi:cAMP-binding proteins - catabolite gene activator and regulatory subunit of cAMP-dependent protein kinases